MKKVLFIEFWNCNPHLETALELAKLHLDAGDRVAFYFAGHDTLYKEEISVAPEDCGLFRSLPEVQGAALIGLSSRDFHGRVKMPTVHCDIPEKFDSLEQLMALKYKTFEVGLAVGSSFISNVRDSQPNLEAHHPAIRQMILSAVQVYELVKRLVHEEAPDLVYLFNGRFCNHRAAMRATLDMGKELLIHERGADRFRYYLQPFMPHELPRWQEMMAREWARGGSSPGAREIGERFFTERRAGLEQFWLSFTDQQKRNLIPAIDPDKKIVTYFSSTDDEYVCVGDVYEFKIWQNQLDAVRDLIRICSKNESIQLFIRLHPNLRNKSLEDQRRWLALGEIKGVNMVSFDSDVDTYALIDRSDVVVTAGSTVGIEAVFWGKPSICLGPAYYSELGATLHPQSSAELESMLACDNLTVDRERAIPFGYGMSTFGRKFVYYVAESLFTGKFLGTDLRAVSSRRLKWLRLKQVASKPHRVLSKLFSK